MRYLLISDIQGNLPAFETILQDVAGEYDAVWYLGDIVGRGPYPNECVELLQSLEPECVVGNEDYFSLGKIDMSDMSRRAKALFVWTQEQLSRKAFNYLMGLPEKLIRENEYTLVHGSPRHPVWEYVLGPAIAQSNFEYLATNYCFVGHTLYPCIFEEASEPGSMGRYFLTEAENGPIKFGEPFQLGKQRLIINIGGGGREKWGYRGISHYGILDVKARKFEYRIAQAGSQAYNRYQSAYRELEQDLEL